MDFGWLDDSHIELTREPLQFGRDSDPGRATIHD